MNQRTREGNNQQPFLRTANVYWGKLDLTTLDRMHFEADEMQRLTLQPGDLLTCEGGNVGRTAIWRGELQQCFHQNHVHRLRTQRSDVEPKFYMRWMEAAITLLGLYAGAHNKTTIPNLSKNRLASFAVPLPPLPEQRAIAAVLRTVQGAKEACEQVLAATRQLKQSLLHHLFTYRPVPFPQAAHVPLKETVIGSMPERWQVLKLGDVARMHTGGTPARAKPAYWNGGIPWVRTGEVNYNVIRQTEETISEKGLENSAAKLIPAGTLLVAMYGQGVTRGCVAILGIEATVNQACAAVFPTEAVTTEFLYAVFVHGYERIRNMEHGAHQTNLSMTLLEQILIPVPPLPEQREIAAQLSALDAKLAAEEARRAALATLFQSLLHHLLTARLRLPEFLNAKAPRREAAKETAT